jgi:hypothetical protein
MSVSGKRFCFRLQIMDISNLLREIVIVICYKHVHFYRLLLEILVSWFAVRFWQESFKVLENCHAVTLLMFSDLFVERDFQASVWILESELCRKCGKQFRQPDFITPKISASSVLISNVSYLINPLSESRKSKIGPWISVMKLVYGLLRWYS